MYRFKVYEDRRGEFRWRLLSSNGRTVADSGEGYGSRSAAREAAQRIKSNAGSAPIEDDY